MTTSYTPAQWNDWRWQLQNAVRTKAQLEAALNLSAEERLGIEHLSIINGLPLLITPHFLQQINRADENDPLRLQVVPRLKEWDEEEFARRDPLGEEDHEVVPHLVHRYPDRVLLLITDRCASYCRFCTRKRWVGQGPTPKANEIQDALAYIKQHPEVKEVVISGGDALMIGDRQLEELLSQIRQIESVEIIRLHTRMLAFAPMRITEELVDTLRRHSPVYVLSHFNHASEISIETQLAISRLVNVGVPVLNQTVLLKGVNDSAPLLAELFRFLTRLKVRPYYLHQCDIAPGTKQFRVPLEKSLALVKALRGNISGLCIPTFVVDIPGGFGKVPLVPDPIVSRHENAVMLEGFMGEVAAYPIA